MNYPPQGAWYPFGQVPCLPADRFCGFIPAERPQGILSQNKAFLKQPEGLFFKLFISIFNPSFLFLRLGIV